MLQSDTMLPPAELGLAILNASSSPVSSPSPRDTAGVATFLFAVIGLLLLVFFTVVLLTTVSRALRRKRRDALSREPTDVSVDAWQEAGKRLGKPKPGGDIRR